MKYVVKLTKTITLEYEMEIDSNDSVVAVMDKAEKAMNHYSDQDALYGGDEEAYPKTASKWAVSSVQTKEEQ